MVDVEEISDFVEEVAPKYLVGLPMKAIPKLIWVDMWASQIFVRAALRKQSPKSMKKRFNALRRRTQKQFKISIVCVLYEDADEWTWEMAADQSVNLALRHGGDLS